MKTEVVRKITLILKRGDKKMFLYPSVRKTQNFLRNKAKHYLKNGYLITIRVSYKSGGTNSGTYDTVEDLNWAFKAFVKEYME